MRDKSFLVVALASLALSGGAVGAAPLTDGLFAYWSMDGDFTDEWQGSGAFGTCTAANPAARCSGFGPMEEALAPGIYHLDISMREDGSALDAVVLDGAGTFNGTDPTTP